MPILELETPEATYRNDMARGCHFVIDCACGGRDGKYHGSHYKNADEDLENLTRGYQPLRANKYAHTFYLSEELFLHQLYEEHREAERQAPVVIVCNDCAREFPFSHESYLDLRDKMMVEYNRRLFEAEKAHEGD